MDVRGKDQSVRPSINQDSWSRKEQVKGYKAKKKKPTGHVLNETALLFMAVLWEKNQRKDDSHCFWPPSRKGNKNKTGVRKSAKLACLVKPLISCLVFCVE